MARVSVVIPAYNAEDYLAQAIDSVLNQSYRDVEVIVVDDGSTDSTWEVICSYGDRVLSIQQPNRRLANARNTGATRAQGEYLAFLDADDWMLPHKLSEQVSYLDSTPGVGLVASGLETVDEHGRHIAYQMPWYHHPSITLELLITDGLIGVHGVLLRRRWFDDIGGFDETLPHCEDMDLWWRLAVAGCSMAWHPVIVGCYRQHEQSGSRSFTKAYNGLVELFNRQLNDDSTPQSVLAQRDRILAMRTIAFSGRLFGSGDIEMAAAALQQAIDLDNSFRNADALAAEIAKWRCDLLIQNRDTVAEYALTHLPESLAWIKVLRRRIDNSFYRSQFFQAAVEKDFRKAGRRWARVALHDPGLLLNRGTWSILLRSLLQGHDNAPRESLSQPQQG